MRVGGTGVFVLGTAVLVGDACVFVGAMVAVEVINGEIIGTVEDDNEVREVGVPSPALIANIPGSNLNAMYPATHNTKIIMPAMPTGKRLELADLPVRGSADSYALFAALLRTGGSLAGITT